MVIKIYTDIEHFPKKILFKCTEKNCMSLFELYKPNSNVPEFTLGFGKLSASTLQFLLETRSLWYILA